MRHVFTTGLIMLATGLPAAQGQMDPPIESLSAPPRVLSETRLGYGTAIRVNRGGQVLVVTGRDVAAGIAQRTFLWSRPVGFTEIRFGGDIVVTHGTDLSDTGSVVGEALSPRGFYEPFIWTAAAGINLISNDLIIEVSSPTAVNDTGEAVGSSNRGQFSYRSGLATGFFYGNPLGGQPGPCSSTGMDVNRWGDSVGGSTIDEHCTEDLRPAHAYVRRRKGSVMDLGTLGGQNSQALAVNDLGQVVGWSETGNGSRRAFLWSPGKGMMNLGTLGGNWSQALGINNRGEVIGLSRTTLGYVHAFWFSPAIGMISLGRGRPASINDLGQVVGTDARSGTSAAFFWSPVHGRTNIAHNARSFQVNDRGQVAGERNTSTPPPTAVLWQLAVTSAETLNWYEARIAVRLYGHLITAEQAAEYKNWIAGARAALISRDQTELDRYLEWLRTALGRP